MRTQGDPLLAGAADSGAHVLLLTSQMLTASNPGVNVSSGRLKSLPDEHVSISAHSGLRPSLVSQSARTKS